VTRLDTARRTATAGRNRALPTAWHAVTAVVVAASLVAQVWLVIAGGTNVNSGADTTPVPLPDRLGNLFSYFTIQSNILVLIGSVWLLVDPFLRGPRRLGGQTVRLTGLLGITITGLVYVVVLRPLGHPTGIAAWVNAGLHYLAPPLAMVGWLLFGPRPRVSWRVIWLSLIWPVAWVLYTLMRGAATGWYPYPFIDVDELGLPVVLRNLGFVLLLAAVILALLKTGDRMPALSGSGDPGVDEREDDPPRR
jgi:hypothetical protein